MAASLTVSRFAAHQADTIKIGGDRAGFFGAARDFAGQGKALYAP
jgi:hypothetical protein